MFQVKIRVNFIKGLLQNKECLQHDTSFGLVVELLYFAAVPYHITPSVKYHSILPVQTCGI